MTLADLPAVVGIDREAKPSPWTRAGFEAELDNPNSRPMVLTAGDAVIGYAVSWLIAGETQIQTVAVHAAWRGQGWGELLLLQALWRGFNQGAVAATLEVRGSNAAALALYAKYRFTVVGERPRYYRDNREAALLMDLVIDRTTFLSFLESRWKLLKIRLMGEDGGGTDM